jgi:hypothetical protein
MSTIQPSELIECVRHWSAFRVGRDSPPTVADYQTLAVFVSPLSAGHPSWEDVRALHVAVDELRETERQLRESAYREDEYGPLFQAQIKAHDAARALLRRPTQ